MGLGTRLPGALRNNSRGRKELAVKTILPPVSTKIRKLRLNYYCHNLRECLRYSSASANSIPYHCLLPYAIVCTEPAEPHPLKRRTRRIQAREGDFAWLRSVGPDLKAAGIQPAVREEMVKLNGKMSKTLRINAKHAMAPRPTSPDPTATFGNAADHGFRSIKASKNLTTGQYKCVAEQGAPRYGSLDEPPGRAARSKFIDHKWTGRATEIVTNRAGLRMLRWETGGFSPMYYHTAATLTYPEGKLTAAFKRMKPRRSGTASTDQPNMDDVAIDASATWLFDVEYKYKKEVMTERNLHADEITTLSWDLRPTLNNMVQGKRGVRPSKPTRDEIKATLKIRAAERGAIDAIPHNEENITLDPPPGRPLYVFYIVLFGRTNDLQSKACF